MCSAVILMLAVMSASAAKVTLRIRAGNPVDSKQKVQVKVDLPKRIGTNEVINLDGLELKYDVKTANYYVFKDLDLNPGQTVVYNVEIKDIWLIADEEMELIKTRAGDLVAKLKGQPDVNEPQAQELKKEIEATIDVVKAAQEANIVKPGVKVVQHINAYESNMLTIRRIKEAVGLLENMVLGTGQDPGDLVGIVKDAPPINKKIELPESAYRIAIFKITAKNVSTNFAHQIDVVRELPSEITVKDIMDPDGLDLKTVNGVAYVFTNKLELAPGAIKTFNVKIRDKWNINNVRIENLKSAASNTLEQLKTSETIVSLKEKLKQLVAELDAIAQEPQPKELNDQYVAFFRNQADRIDPIEEKINRITAAIKPMNKNTEWGIGASKPNPKTTWIIIYIIMGFLLLVSLIFFLRWLGAGKG